MNGSLSPSVRSRTWPSNLSTLGFLKQFFFFPYFFYMVSSPPGKSNPSMSLSVDFVGTQSSYIFTTPELFNKYRSKQYMSESGRRRANQNKPENGPGWEGIIGPQVAHQL